MKTKSPFVKAIIFSGKVFLLLLATGLINEVLAKENQPVKANSSGFLTFLGRLHPMIVHFPIGLLYAALLFEFIAWKSNARNFFAATKVLVFTGALSSILSVVFGLVLSKTDSYGSSILSIHQWIGIATMAFAIVTAYCYQKGSRKIQYLMLFATVLGVTVAGHYGAELTHGEDYLSSAFSDNSAVAATNTGEEDNLPDFILASQKTPLSESQLQDLNIQVRTVFAHHCYSCHGPLKMKGDLRLDSKEGIFKGGKNGSVFTPGRPEKSELIRRVSLPANDKDVMPSKGQRLSLNEIQVLSYWIRQGAPWPTGPEKSLYRQAELEPRNPEIPQATGDLTNPIDRFVNAYFEKNNIKWGTPVNDRLYIRRVYLDVIGLLPPADSVDAFINDKHPEKRARLVNSLLARNDDYAQHWLTFWNDALRNDYTGTGYITNGRSDITKWLYTSIRNNKPYNEFVKELISPDSSSLGFIRGIEWRGVVNASQRTEMQAAQNVSQVFMGLNLKCASCHDSFISDWKLDQSYAFANIFSDSLLEINRCDKPTGKFAGRQILYKQLGQINSSASKSERLKELADSLVQPRDGRLYRTLVNRIWAQLMGRGIVEPVDAMDNKPWSQDLLDWLAYNFVANGCDIKKLIYEIAISKTYQLPSVAVKDAGLISAPGFKFAGMLRKRLTAEQFADAVSEAIQPVYGDSMIVYNLLPKEIKGTIPFPRASLVKNDPFLTALGRPNRETVTTSRSSNANLLQALELTNGAQFNAVIKQAAAKWKKKYPDPKKMVENMYRNTLGRLPNAAEEKTALLALGNEPTENNIQDFIWAMAMHPEFQLLF
ncbi:MAG TPA: DUF1549 domain-containing protein [Puia sp.]|nr:DUF1549 domain-containing protein [Puia sp.]